MKFNFSTLQSLITLVLTVFLFSCEPDPLDIDISEIKLDLKVKRFDQELFINNTNISAKEVDELYNNYGLFFKDFAENIINIGPVTDPPTIFHLNFFKNDNQIKQINDDVQAIYSDFSSYEVKFEDAFKHFKHYFPKKYVPKIITYISGFNYAVVTDSTYLGIGLDMFLGNDYSAYTQLGLPQYKINSMTKDHLVPGVLLGWASTEFELETSHADLLTEMIHQGKLLYFLDALLPKEHPSFKLGYSKEQIKWCDLNETQVWFHFIDNELLYTKENQKMIKYMGEAPFIQGFPEGSPGKVGHWVGLQIVKAYMKNNPEISLAQLMQNQDAQKILNKSKYKP